MLRGPECELIRRYARVLPESALGHLTIDEVEAAVVAGSMGPSKGS
jgi:hypothetical protein